MFEEIIVKNLIFYSHVLDEYGCNNTYMFSSGDRFKIKFFLVNKKVAFEYIMDLTEITKTGITNEKTITQYVESQFEDMIDWYEMKCTKWCGGVKDDKKGS